MHNRGEALIKEYSGVLVVDKFGLPIESFCKLDASQAGLVSSIMKNVGKLSQLLQ